MAPEQRPPTVTNAPPPGRKFPCEKCGAKLDFDPASRALQCPYCGHTQTIEPSKASVVKHDLEAALRKVQGSVIAGRSTQVQCAACGAVVLLEDKVATDRCPYCSANLENKPEAAEAMIAPEGVIPFVVTNRLAIDAYRRWLAGLWFAPSALKQFAEAGQWSGVYVPFWTFDSMTYTHYTGQRGEDYTVTETYTETDAQGQTVTKTRQVVKTRWYHVSGEVQHFFQDLFVCASKGVPENYALTLQPRDLKGLEAFRPDFLSGFKTERYTIGPGPGFDRAKAIMDGEIRELCRRDIGGDHQMVETVNTQHVGVTYRHILLPLWLTTYRYQNTPYRVLVNGQTGQVMGDRPYSWVKIVILIVAILAAVIAGFLIFSRVARGATVDPPHEKRVILWQSDEKRGTTALNSLSPDDPGVSSTPPEPCRGAAPSNETGRIRPPLSHRWTDFAAALPARWGSGGGTVEFPDGAAPRQEPLAAAEPELYLFRAKHSRLPLQCSTSISRAPCDMAASYWCHAI